MLPTAENLWKRRVVQDPICSRCKIKAESIIHAILECKPSRHLEANSLVYRNECAHKSGFVSYDEGNRKKKKKRGVAEDNCAVLGSMVFKK